jgi:hypothetical protein
MSDRFSDIIPGRFSVYQKIIPTRFGTDIENQDGTLDAHIRIETYRGVGTNLFVDLFDSSIRDASEAHLKSEVFPWTDEGADRATRFLQRHGFRVVVMLR